MDLNFRNFVNFVAGTTGTPKPHGILYTYIPPFPNKRKSDYLFKCPDY